MNSTISTITAAAGAVLLLAASQAGAVTEERSFVQNAVGMCPAALPAYEGQIRKRPLAVQNEGTAPAFVTCSFMGTDRSDNGVTDMYLYSDNNSAATVSLTCTLVTGSSGSGAPEFISKTLSMPANTKSNEFLWRASDNGGANYDNFTTNVSCSLPVGTGLTTSFVYYDVDVGN